MVEMTENVNNTLEGNMNTDYGGFYENSAPCNHCYHLFQVTIHMAIKPGDILMDCCKCGALKTVHSEHTYDPRFIMTNEQIRELEKGNAELAVWGLKKSVLSKRQEVVDLELQVRQAQDVLDRLKRRVAASPRFTIHAE
jgi:hypothetical protein